MKIGAGASANKVGHWHGGRIISREGLDGWVHCCGKAKYDLECTVATGQSGLMVAGV